MTGFKVLERIGYITENGLVFCGSTENIANNYEILLLAEAEKLGAKAVLFRRYYDEKSDKFYKSEPAVYIFQEDDNFFNSEANISLHAKIWSAGKAEIYIILGQTKIDIINARKPAEVKTTPENEKELDLSNVKFELIKDTINEFNDIRFSTYLFGTGTFWEQSEFQVNLKEKDNPYIHLLNYLMSVRNKFSQKDSGLDLSASTADRILILSILVKFLEEIKDDNGKHTLQDIYKSHEINSFEEALRQAKTITILDDLSSVFNGRIFDLAENSRSEIQGKALHLIADFLSGEVDKETKQMFLWKQYDFKYLPAEVISAIYENFIQIESLRENNTTEKGVVYTPIHLVNLLIDEVMPLDKAKEYFEDESFKILDPTCGSGVFLVAAFKRMLQWWAINNSTPSNIQYPQAKDAQRIMEKNIFGVDVQSTATLVSIFGLTTALLEKLTPQEIWYNLKFNDLNENIQTKNFFEWAVTAPKDFDLVIGNPPFNVPTNHKNDKTAYEQKFILPYKERIRFNYIYKNELNFFYL
jgi:hypothetical protein